MAPQFYERVRLSRLSDDFRHVIGASGVNLKVIKERMGHGAEAFTLSRYVHVVNM